MHWNTGTFHGPITVEKEVYITEFKYPAISGEFEAITYSSDKVTTTVLGKGVNVKSTVGITAEANNDISVTSKTGSITITSNKGVTVRPGANGYFLISDQTNAVVSINSVKGEITLECHKNNIDDSHNRINIAENDIVVHTESGNVKLEANEYIEINPKKGTTLASNMYGNQLPSSGIQGQLFFKLIA